MNRLPLVLVAFVSLLSLAGPALAGEIGYLEDFALAADRNEALKQLIPGTEEYYYFHCIHYMNLGQWDTVDEYFKFWDARHHGWTPLMREIENRRRLLRYTSDPAGTMQYLREQLNLHYNHQRQRLDKEVDLPTRLDPALISRQALARRARATHSDLGGFSQSALDWLANEQLNVNELRHLLRRLNYPDLSNLPQLVKRELDEKTSRGFGTFPIHGKMTLAQLDALLKLEPSLINNDNFVYTYCSKIRPPADVDLDSNPEAMASYLDRMWSFVGNLPPVFNSLKASVLYQRLAFDRSQGVYDADRFLAYIKLPRYAPYIQPRYVEDYLKQGRSNRSHLVNFGQSFGNATIWPPIGQDEPLIRSYLLEFYRDADALMGYETYLRNAYLTSIYAEAKILADPARDAERLASMLHPQAFQALKDRVDIEFAYTNTEYFTPGQAVSLDVDIKNVEKLIVKVYQINTVNYYRQVGRPLDTTLNLDGLVPNREIVKEYDAPPLKRHRETFTFDDLGSRGVYVIDFIGNGKASRALVRLGKLQYILDPNPAGQGLWVLNDANELIKDARVYIGGHEFKADENGYINIPYSTNPGRETIVLADGEFATIDRLERQAESYSLQAGFYVDREALLSRNQAQVLIRPMLYCNGEPAPSELLEDVTLTISSADLDGISSSHVVNDLEFKAGEVKAVDFTVPSRLSQLAFSLTAKVESITAGKDVDVAASSQVGVNNIDRTPHTESLHLLQIDGRWVLDLLGKSGEALAGRPVTLSINHKDFVQPVTVTLETSETGRIELGELADIVSIQARSPEGVQQQWTLPTDEFSYTAQQNQQAGQAVRIPYMGQATKPDRAELSLLELRGGQFVKDCFDSLRIEDGYIVIDDLPAGDYLLRIKSAEQSIAVSFADGQAFKGRVITPTRAVEVRYRDQLQIRNVKTGDDALTVSLANVNPTTRVHVLATRFEPAFDAFAGLNVPMPVAQSFGRAPANSGYVSGRDLGDEYRYILDRKYAVKFPGNMLTRPSLLLNPWALRETQTGRQTAETGGQFKQAGASRGRESSFMRAHGKRRSDQQAGGDFADLNFLASPSVVLANLPVKDGPVVIPRDKLGPHQQIRIVATDVWHTVSRDVSLPEPKVEYLDLRLREALDAQRHFAQTQLVSVLPGGQAFTVPDATSSRIEVYDSLEKVYGLYRTLNGDAKFAEFAFILRWPELTDAEKRDRYSEYACHELNFFLYHKDKGFFEAVVLPYLAHKKDKTFMDHYLLGDDLAAYRQPWQHERLNVAERVLLARRIEAEAAATARHVRELWELIPPNPAEFSRLFETAIGGRSLQPSGQTIGGPVFSNGRLGVVRDRGWRAASFEAADAPAPLEPAARPQAAMPTPEVEADEDLGVAKPEELDESEGDVKWYDKVRYPSYSQELREDSRQMYRKVEATQEWVENNYYKLPIEQQVASLVPVSGFWKDYAQFAAGEDGEGFLSANLAEAHRNFTEAMLALAVLDLPFKPAEHETAYEQPKLTITPGGSVIAFHEQIAEVAPAEEAAGILVSENFFRHGDRYVNIGNERRDKYVTDEFLKGVVYGSHIVLTNPTSTPRRLSVLLQVPAGAIPVAGGKYTRSIDVQLQPYHTQQLEHYFYFPTAGEFAHYPATVARDDAFVGSAEPFAFNVVDELSQVDETSWDYISQFGSPEDVLGYLQVNNLQRTNLDRIAWRMKDKAFFSSVIALLTNAHVYNHTLWSYGVYHQDPAVTRTFLMHMDGFVQQCGMDLASPLLDIKPVERHWYQHKEYWPLVNARAHKLGREREITNEPLLQQYKEFLNRLMYHAELSAEDRLAAAYYLLLQDRVTEGLAFFDSVDREAIATKMQYDYAAVYAAFYREELDKAREIAAGYAEYPVDRWRERFASAVAQLDEIAGGAATVIEEDNREQEQTKLAATEPSFDFKVEARQVKLNYQNLQSVTVNYYLMDIELLFSTNPFVEGQTGQFAWIQPNLTQTLTLGEDVASGKTTFDLPEEFRNANVLVEIVAGGKRTSQPYYANSLAVQVVENYGQVEVRQAESRKPLSKVYVKVYARKADGSAAFYKDGYTDLRGRFDYATLSVDELDGIVEFAILVLSDEHGAVVRTTAPPKR
jgi:hypothetical protein